MTDPLVPRSGSGADGPDSDGTAPDGSGAGVDGFVEFARTRSRSLRNRLVEEHMGLAHLLASRYRRGGADEQDLDQVALLALVKAVDRFDPGRGVAFGTFAGRTIDGELKRHFRDRTWALRVPRSVKDLHVAVRRASEEMEQALGRSPTVRELADRLDVGTDEVIGALGAASARRAGSLVQTDDDAPPDHVAVLGHPDLTPEVDDRDQVEHLLAGLGEREREIVRLRFYEQLSQDQIAERVGLSQMHVSRLLRQSFAKMRSLPE